MPDHTEVPVIATTISGSIGDWRKMARIVPLFRELGHEEVFLEPVDSHREAREHARNLVADGYRNIISAGGSGTFNSVLEGCIDARVPLDEISLGFLRKGSADLIGKTLEMPDQAEAAVQVFSDCLESGTTVDCDVIRVGSDLGGHPPRHFVGYGGAEIFGRIPHYTENRLMKYYKGVLGQLGDLGPFTVGAILASLERIMRQVIGQRREWTIAVDGEQRSAGRYQAIIIVNGDLGPDLPFAHSVPLGSGDFHAFALRDLGAHRLPGQFRRAFDGSIESDPDRWGFEHYRIENSLVISPRDLEPFPVNVDGSTLLCRGAADLRIVDRIRLMAVGGVRNRPRTQGSYHPRV